MQITLSRRQARAADRFTGVLLVLPWPPRLPRAKALGSSTGERVATDAEHAAAIQMLATACATHSLVCVQSYVKNLRVPDDGTVQPTRGDFLCTLVVHSRWPIDTDIELPARKVWCAETIQNLGG